MNWLLQHTPVEVWLILGVGSAFALHRYVGLRAALLALGTAVLLIINAKGRKAGWDAREEKGKEDAENAIKEADLARRDSDLRNANPDGLRSSDGFRRD